MNSKVTRIPKLPSRLPAVPVKRVLSELNLNANSSEEPPKKQLPMRKFLSRRSKSVADFKGVASKDTALRNFTLTRKPAAKTTDDLKKGVTTSKKLEVKPKPFVPVKRKAEKVEQPKPKVTKVSKPAPYDYKAR